MTYSPEDWKRLGKAVYAARIRAGFRDTNQWAAAVGRSTRVVLGLERGEVTGKGTLTEVEAALDWPPGTAEGILASAHYKLPSPLMSLPGAPSATPASEFRVVEELANVPEPYRISVVFQRADGAMPSEADLATMRDYVSASYTRDVVPPLARAARRGTPQRHLQPESDDPA